MKSTAVDAPDLLNFTCPQCHSVLTVPAAKSGVEGPCPTCRAWVRSPVAPRRSRFSVRSVVGWLRRSAGSEPRWQVLFTVLATGIFGVISLRILATIQQFVYAEPTPSLTTVPGLVIVRGTGS